MGDLKGKKLLILGGDARSCDFVYAARELGVYTVVTDWYDPSRSPAKLVADEYWNEEVFNTEKLLALIKENNIDGVITGYTDTYLLKYYNLCKVANLPCYSTKDIFEITLDKSRFKQACRENNVPTVPEYDISTFDPSVISEDLKVIIKPVDNSGSRGIRVCSKPEDFQECVDFALSFSQKKEIIIERFIEMDNISLFYTIQDGIISLSSINDRYVHFGPNRSASSSASIYPSKYIDFYVSNYDECVKEMYRKLGAKNGVLSIGAFTNGIELYIYEMGYRLTGGRHYIYTDYENNSNAVKQLITFALTGSMADYSIAERDNPYFKDYCCKLYILGLPGKIAEMKGTDYFKSIPECIKYTIYKKEGDMVGADGTTAQQIAMVNLIVKDWNRFLEIQKDIRANFKVFDAEGNDLVIDFMK